MFDGVLIRSFLMSFVVATSLYNPPDTEKRFYAVLQLESRNFFEQKIFKTRILRNFETLFLFA